MTNWDIELLYDEYCADCYAEGTTPMEMWAWWDSLE